MIRNFDGKLEKINISKYCNDELFYKNLWLKKYNFHIGKKTKEDLKNKIKSQIFNKIKILQ
jgi:hypothetical protein